MLDPQLLRSKTEEVARLLQARGYLLDTERFQRLEEDRKQLQIKQQELQHPIYSTSSMTSTPAGGIN